MILESNEPITPEQLMEQHGIDRAVWLIKKIIVNQWESAAVGADGSIVITPLRQLKLHLERAPSAVVLDVPRRLTPDTTINAPTHDDLLGEVHMPDAHFGKLCWAPEVGENYNIAAAQSAHLAAAGAFYAFFAQNPPSRIVYIIGSDMIHTDNKNNQTTAGTVVDTDGRWQKIFNAAFETCINVADLLATVTNKLEIIVIPGNHDGERSYYLGHSLAQYYKNSEYITVDNRPLMRKYLRFGVNQIGWTHAPNKRLPLIMVEEAKPDLNVVQFKAWHIGHLHKEREDHYVGSDTHEGTTVEIVPSLCAMDAWHSAQCYRSTRKAKAYLWHVDRGLYLVRHFNWMSE